MKKPSKCKPRSHRGTRKGRPAASNALASATAAKLAGPKASQGSGKKKAHTVTGAGTSPVGLKGIALFYEGIMGTAPPREPRSHRQGAGGAWALALPYTRDDAEALAMLSVPIIALFLVFGAAQVTRTVRRSGPSEGATVSTARPAIPSVAATQATIATLRPSGVDPVARIGRDRLVELAPVASARPLVRPRPPTLDLKIKSAPEAVGAYEVGERLVTADGTVGTADARGGPEAYPADLRATTEPQLVGEDLGGRLAMLAPSAAPEIETHDRPIAPPVAVVPARPPAAIVSRGEPGDEPTVCSAPDRPARQAWSAQTPQPAAFGSALARAAREQTSDFVIYNDTYRTIAYPMGDVPPLYGVCTDVVIRAYRALGVDLQQLVHESRLGSGDTSIEHRRTETLRRFFARFGEAMPPSSFAEDYHPGDIVTYDRPQNRHSRSHIAVVSDVLGASGRYMIVHNRGWGPQIEDALFVDEITGHYRYAGAAATGHLQGELQPACGLGGRLRLGIGCGTPFAAAAGHIQPVDGAPTRGLGH